ncbi:hypothetical protein FRC11_013733, partial [Ceratobasidium sp. 423]
TASKNPNEPEKSQGLNQGATASQPTDFLADLTFNNPTGSSTPNPRARSQAPRPLGISKATESSTGAPVLAPAPAQSLASAPVSASAPTGSTRPSLPALSIGAASTVPQGRHTGLGTSRTTASESPVPRSASSTTNPSAREDPLGSNRLARAAGAIARNSPTLSPLTQGNAEPSSSRERATSVAPTWQSSRKRGPEDNAAGSSKESKKTQSASRTKSGGGE